MAAGERASNRSDAVDNRRRILVAAREVLAERGLEAEVMQIAERAGVGAGTFYRNFPAKQDLVAAVVAELAGAFEAAVARAPLDGSASDALEYIIRAGFELAGEYGRLLLEVLGAGAGPGPAPGRFNREMVRGRIREICRRGVERGEFLPDLDADFALGMLQGLFAPRALEYLQGTRGMTQIADLAVAFYLRGLGGGRTGAR